MDMTLFFIVSCVGLILYFHFVHPRFMQVTEDPKRDRKTSRSPATCDTQHRMKEDTQLTIPSEKHMPSRGVGRSIRGALALLFWDVVISGSFCASLLICPIWFLVSILKNLIQRPGWKIALFGLQSPPQHWGWFWLTTLCSAEWQSQTLRELLRLARNIMLQTVRFRRLLTISCRSICSPYHVLRIA